MNRGYYAFSGSALIAKGSVDVIRKAVRAYPDGSVVVIDDHTGQVTDLPVTDLPGHENTGSAGDDRPRRGRPKLGVVAREVTLLPRHWEWLTAQPGGASQTLRRLTDAARKEDADRTSRRLGMDAAFRVMTTLAGDATHYEDAVRALYASDMPRLEQIIAAWPGDVQNCVRIFIARALSRQSANPDTVS